MRKLWILLPLCSGCAWVMNVDGGAVVAMDLKSTEHPPAAPEALLAMHTAAAYQNFGLGLSARSRLAARGFEMGAGPEICWMPALGPVNPYACAGASLLTLGYRDDAFSLGAMSPYVQPAVSIALGEDTPNSLFVSVPVGFDFRVTDQPSSFYAGVALGFGWSLNSGRIKNR